MRRCQSPEAPPTAHPVVMLQGVHKLFRLQGHNVLQLCSPTCCIRISSICSSDSAWGMEQDLCAGSHRFSEHVHASGMSSSTTSYGTCGPARLYRRLLEGRYLWWSSRVDPTMLQLPDCSPQRLISADISCCQSRLIAARTAAPGFPAACSVWLPSCQLSSRNLRTVPRLPASCQEACAEDLPPAQGQNCAYLAPLVAPRALHPFLQRILLLLLHRAREGLAGRQHALVALLPGPALAA